MCTFSMLEFKAGGFTGWRLGACDAHGDAHGVRHGREHGCEHAASTLEKLGDDVADRADSTGRGLGHGEVVTERAAMVG